MTALPLTPEAKWRRLAVRQVRNNIRRVWVSRCWDGWRLQLLLDDLTYLSRQARRPRQGR